jgi:DNA-binding CsgD family transcriptional regulator
LVGYSAGDWSDWSVLGAREFTNLPAGNYRFEVEANWFGTRAERSFSVLPPWYQSKVAYLVYALLLMFLARLLYRLHLRRLSRQARHLEVLRQRELQRERIVARNRELRTDVKRKSKELANTTLTVAKKNEMLLALKEELAKGRDDPSVGIDHRKVGKLIDRNLNNKEDWAIFESHFNEVHEAFLKRLRKEHLELTTGDLKLAAYLRMDLSSKEIAPLLHISLRGVENKRYRLRKKIGLEGDDNLNRYLLEF